MSAKPAAIPLFGDAYLADTRHLTTEEHGAYLLLMMAAWRQDDCALPDNDRKLARITGLTPRKWTSIKPTIMEFWQVENGRIFQGRLRKERAYVDQKSESNRKSAEARWNKQPIENKQSDECERISERNAPPPSPPQDEKDTEAKASGAKPPSLTAADVTKSVWDTGKAILKAAGHDDRQAGSIIGRFRKTYSDSQVLIALSRCQIEQPSEPLEWLTKALQSEANQNGRISAQNDRGSVRGTRPNPALDMVLQAERELQAEAFSQNTGSYWSARLALPSH